MIDPVMRDLYVHLRAEAAADARDETIERRTFDRYEELISEPASLNTALNYSTQDDGEHIDVLYSLLLTDETDADILRHAKDLRAVLRSIVLRAAREDATLEFADRKEDRAYGHIMDNDYR